MTRPLRLRNTLLKRLSRTLLAVGALIVTYATALTIFPTGPDPDTVDAGVAVIGTGSESSLETTYANWASSYAETDPAGPVVALQWTRGLSSRHSPAKGIAQFDLEKNVVSVRVKGLDPAITDVWLVDNIAGEGRSIIPEEGDEMVKLGSLQFDGENAWLDGQMADLANFKVDMVVLTEQGGHPGADGVLVGTTSLFQRLYHYPDQQLAEISERQIDGEESSIASLFVKQANATAGITPRGFFPGVDSKLINFGRQLFFEETFDGNGRTCGTCHKEDDNLALGIRTIAALPDDDPLFIVEQRYRRDGSRNALFQDFRMEKPALMRRAGLILENLNGFREPDGSFTTRVNMRAPQHVLSIRTTLAPPPAQAFDDGTLPVDPADLVFAERTGWSGDGTPTGFREDFFRSNGRDLTGALRDFAIGAIVQHFPLTLERSANRRDEFGRHRQPDFRFATEFELDAMEAFMLSVGRQEPNESLETIRLKDVVAERGRLNYMGFNVFDADPNDGRPPLNCNACHFNGGSNTNPEFPFPPGIGPNHDLADLAAAGGSIESHNRSFGPQVERLLDQPGDIIVQVVDDPSVRGNCFEQGLAEVPLLGSQEQPGVPSEGCDANPFDNGFAFQFDDQFADRRAADNRFNIPVVFEAMDTPPFFHGHQVNTVEGSVAFYAAGRHLRNGENLGPIVPLNASQIINVARFIRVMGADFNASSAITLVEKSLFFHRFGGARAINIDLARAELEDAIELLDGGIDLHFQDAIPLLEQARSILRHGTATHTSELFRARSVIKEAQDVMLERNVNAT